MRRLAPQMAASLIAARDASTATATLRTVPRLVTWSPFTAPP